MRSRNTVTLASNKVTHCGQNWKSGRVNMNVYIVHFIKVGGAKLDIPSFIIRTPLRSTEPKKGGFLIPIVSFHFLDGGVYKCILFDVSIIQI
jgi:hypothetical protein